MKAHARKLTLDCQVAKELGISVKGVRLITQAFVAAVRTQLATEGVVFIDGLGRLRVYWKSGRVQQKPIKKQYIAFAKAAKLIQALEDAGAA